MAINTMTSNLTAAEDTGRSDAGAALRRNVTSAYYVAAAVLILISIYFPYWGMTLQAPQYPAGLSMRVFVNRMTGDEDPVLDEVREIDNLNHYIGMQSLYNAARFERAIAIQALIIMHDLLIVAALWRNRWSWILSIPAFTFPFVFLADLGLWLRHYGLNLDPSAPLSSAIEPFVPPLFGEGVIGNFATVASVHLGWYLALAAALLILIGSGIRVAEIGQEYLNRQQ